MASELSVEETIKNFTEINPRNDYKMIIGLNKSDLFNERRSRDNIHDVDVIINYDIWDVPDRTEIFEFNGRFILLLRLDINEDYLKLSNFGTSEIIENQPPVIFGRFREISFDWSTVKFLENSNNTILKIIFCLTLLLNRDGLLYLPNLSEVNRKMKQYSSIKNLLAENPVLFQDGIIDINLELDIPTELILKNIYLINDNQIKLGNSFNNENIFNYNFRVLQNIGFDVNRFINHDRYHDRYPIKNSTEIDFGDGRITDYFYILTPRLIPLISLVLGYVGDQERFKNNVKFKNRLAKQFYKNKYLNYKDKYLKYKNKYLKYKYLHLKNLN